jgi:hypothetical protein
LWFQGFPSDYLHNQLEYGYFLQAQDRDEEAMPLLVTALAGFVIPDPHNHWHCTMFTLWMSYGKRKYRTLDIKMQGALEHMKHVIKDI